MNLSKLLFLIFLFTNLPIALKGENSRYIELVDSIDLYLQREKWDKAESLIITALKEEPANFQNHILFSNLGVVRTQLGKIEEALEAFNLGLSLAPRSTVIMNNRAKTFLTIGEYEKALEDIDKSLDIDGTQEWPHLMRGTILIYKNELEDAINDFSYVLQNNNQSSLALSGLGKAYDQKGIYDEALKYYNESLEIYDDPAVRSLLILLLIKIGKHYEASLKIQESLALYPENPDFYIWRGYLHKLNYRKEEAEADKKIAISKGADLELINIYLQ